MKKAIIWLSAIIVVSFLLSAVFFFNSGAFDFNYGYVTGTNAKTLLGELNNFTFVKFSGNSCTNANINQTVTKNLENISNLYISSLSTDVLITSKNVSKATFNLYGTGCNHKLISSENGSNLNINLEYPTFRSWFSGIGTSLKLKIILPENYSKNIYLNTVSGEINYFGSNLTSCNLKTVSGDMHLSNVYCQNENLKTTSGEINLNNGSLENIKTTSGDIKLKNVLIDKNSQIQTVSGEVLLYPTSNSNFNLNYITTSGDFHGNKSYGNTNNSLKVKTTSGDLFVR